MSAEILVVDDTPLNVKLVADLLSLKGYRTFTAASGAEALQQLEAEKPARTWPSTRWARCQPSPTEAGLVTTACRI